MSYESSSAGVEVTDKTAASFHDGVERREALLNAIRERSAEQSVLSALREFMSGRGPFQADPDPEFRLRMELIMGTPALRDFTRTLWIRCEGPLAEANAEELGRAPSDPTTCAIARYVLEIPQIVSDGPEPSVALDAICDLFEHSVDGVTE